MYHDEGPDCSGWESDFPIIDQRQFEPFTLKYVIDTIVDEADCSRFRAGLVISYLAWLSSSGTPLYRDLSIRDRIEVYPVLKKIMVNGSRNAPVGSAHQLLNTCLLNDRPRCDELSFYYRHQKRWMGLDRVGVGFGIASLHDHTA